MTTRIKLLCHGSTAAVRAAAFPGDEPVDSQGMRKLAAFSHRLLRADRTLTSPALRAVQTAEALELDATVEPLLRECDYGLWTGRTLADLQEQKPEAVAEWLQNPEAAPHGGESVAMLTQRVAAWLDVQKSMVGTTVAITHASVIRAAIVHAIEAGPRSFWRIDVAPLSLTQLSSANGHWTLVSVGGIPSAP